MFNLFKKKSIIGVDISDYSVEILQLDKNNEVAAYGRATLEEGIVRNGRILNKEKLAQKIKDILESKKANFLKIPNGRLQAVLSLPESRTFIYHFDLPKNLKQNDLKQRIFEEASKIVPYNPQQIFWDYQVFQKQKNVSILYVGVLKEIIYDYVETLSLAGVQPIVFDVESLSLGRALFSFDSTRQNESLMIVDIGAWVTILSVFDNKGVLSLSVTIPVAGGYFTKAIAEKLNIKKEEAEKLKIIFGFDEKNKDNKILPILDENLEKIVKEINGAVQYYEKKSGEKIKEIILAGGSALLPKISERLSLKTNKKAIIGNPLKKIRNGTVLGEENASILFANVIGLALRAASDVVFEINLLPEDKNLRFGSQEETSKLKFLRSFRENFLTMLKNKNPSKRAVWGSVVFVIFSFLFLGFIIYQYIWKPMKNPPLPPPQQPLENNEIQPLAAESTGTVSAVVPNIPASEAEKEKNIAEGPAKVIIKDTPTGWLNAREGPGTDFPKIGKVYPQKIYILLEEKDEWYKIKIDETAEGWIFSRYADKINNGQ